LYETIQKLNYNLVKYEHVYTTETYNLYNYLIKKKDVNNRVDKKINFFTPLFKDKLNLITYNNVKYYKSENLNLYFNIIDDIPILLLENTIVINK
tara:strand:- start:1163 stop:1447 length:285 start_codon:yes stop_codon:yes gene_type:complete